MIPGHTTRAPPVGFELETNGFQFYAIANLDKTSLMMMKIKGDVVFRKYLVANCNENVSG